MSFVCVVDRGGKPAMRSKNLACIVRYAKQRSDLVTFGVARRIDLATGKPYYLLGLRFEDGATCNTPFFDWRAAVRFLALGSRRANGPFPVDLQPSPGCLPEAAALFYMLRDMHKGGGRQGNQKTPTKAEKGE